MLYGTVLQHNEARPHAACHATQFFANNNVQVFPWPSMSQDLDPNKHTRNELERQVRSRVKDSANVHESFQALKQEWVAILAQVIHNLIQPMPKTCWAVIYSRGGHIPTDVCFPQSQNTEWLNAFLTEKSAKIMNFDLNQLQNKTDELDFCWIF